MPIDKQKTWKLLEELVAIDSVNPTLAPATRHGGQAAGRAGASGEQRASEHVRDFLRANGIAAELEEAEAGRPNVVARIPPFAKNAPFLRQGKQDGALSKDGSKKAGLLIVAHIDTVGAGDMRDPFTPRVRDEKMLLRRHTAEAAIVLEPTDLKLVIAHKGYAWFEIVTHGRTAHGSLPAEGRDAIRMMGRVLAALDELETRLASRAPHPRLGNASLHASLIEGGQELSSYPAECRLQLERRMLPGETEQSAEAELREMLAGLAKQDAEFCATLRGGLGARPAYEIREDAPLVQRARKIITHVCGACELAGMAAWTDTALLTAAGIPGVVFGPTGRGLHGAEEYVELDSVTKCAAALHELILEFCS